MTSKVQSSEDAAARKRGLKRIAVAIVLLLLALVLLLVFQPAAGERYPIVPRTGIQVVALSGYAALLSGLWRTIVGAGVGALAPLLKAVAIATVVVGIVVGIVAGWLVHALVTEPWSAHDGHHHHHDWD